MNRIYVFLSLARSIPAVGTFLFSKRRTDIREDILRCSYLVPYRRKDGVLALNFLLVTRREFRNVFYYRVGLDNRGLARLLHLFYPPLRDMMICGEIAGGLAVFHGFASVVSVNKAGKNLSVYQQVTVGKNPKDRDALPTIGDNVNLYAGAILMGDIKIGSNVEIGAGSVVTKDVPDGCVAVGNPARIVRRNGLRVDQKL